MSLSEMFARLIKVHRHSTRFPEFELPVVVVKIRMNSVHKDGLESPEKRMLQEPFDHQVADFWIRLTL